MYKHDERKFEGHALVKGKNGVRSLYYDLDVTFKWKAEVRHRGSIASPQRVHRVSRITRHRRAQGFLTAREVTSRQVPRMLKGILRVYNVSHETQYLPGGDTSQAYMYETAVEAGGTTDAWTQAAMNATHDLFEVASGVIGQALMELSTK